MKGRCGPVRVSAGVIAVAVKGVEAASHSRRPIQFSRHDALRGMSTAGYFLRNTPLSWMQSGFCLIWKCNFEIQSKFNQANKKSYILYYIYVSKRERGKENMWSYPHYQVILSLENKRLIPPRASCCGCEAHTGSISAAHAPGLQAPVQVTWPTFVLCRRTFSGARR